MPSSPSILNFWKQKCRKAHFLQIEPRNRASSLHPECVRIVFQYKIKIWKLRSHEKWTNFRNRREIQTEKRSRVCLFSYSFYVPLFLLSFSFIVLFLLILFLKIVKFLHFFKLGTRILEIQILISEKFNSFWYWFLEVFMRNYDSIFTFSREKYNFPDVLVAFIRRVERGATFRFEIVRLSLVSEKKLFSAISCLRTTTARWRSTSSCFWANKAVSKKGLNKLTKKNESRSTPLFLHLGFVSWILLFEVVECGSIWSGRNLGMISSTKGKVAPKDVDSGLVQLPTVYTYPFVSSIPDLAFSNFVTAIEPRLWLKSSKPGLPILGEDREWR